jgi:hypothetical protein
MYHFCLQEVNQPAQFSQEEGCLKRKTVPESYNASEPVKKDGHLACFAEHAASISTFLDTQEFFQEAKHDKIVSTW